MDDPSMTNEHLRTALQNLRWINRWLGGYRASADVLAPLLRAHSSLRVLDVGTGGGDYLPAFVRWGQAAGCTVTAVGVDLNPVTVGHGRAWLDASLPAPLRPQARIDIGDALALPYPDDAFDVGHAALFLHHLYDEQARRLLHELQRVSRRGIVINDLHRHPLAYAGIWSLSRLLSFSPMVQHDGPLSVRRGFRREELRTLARQAGLPSPRIRWHWAFRWTLSTLPA
jgi:SAM-dependent methyltransferase